MHIGRSGAGPRDKHFLLDNVHVHSPGEPEQGYRDPCGASWPRRRRRREEVSLVLSVGAVHALLPRGPLLRAPLDVETVGGGQGPDDLRGHARRHVREQGRKKGQDVEARRVHRRHSPSSQQLRCRLFLLRGAELR